MGTPKRALLRAKEFATRCGVTVRTLHFYDRLGLLAPTDEAQAALEKSDEDARWRAVPP